MRPELARRLAEVGACAGWQWTAEREQAVWEDVRRTRAHAPIRGVAAAVVVLAVTVVGWFGFVTGGTEERAVAEARGVGAGLLMQLDDGSTVTAVRPGARLEPVEVASNLVAVRLHAGAARFSVTPDKKRRFQVLAGPYTVVVVGTVFTVVIGAADVAVQVEEGTVRIRGQQGVQRIEAGGRVVLPVVKQEAPPAVEPSQEPSAPDQADDDAKAAPDRPQGAMRRTVTPSRSNALSWRELAHRGQYGKAYERLQAEGPSAVRDDAGDLLLVADVARLSGHPSAAESALRRVVRNHGGDSRAPLAAFTLGRVLLDDYGRPADAARAFSRARQLAPYGVLAEDALAREVECRARAGQKELAQRLAEQYKKSYPAGQRTKTVEHYGGL